MSEETTRIPVPTNGHRPRVAAAAANGAALETASSADAAPAGRSERDAPAPLRVAAGTDLRVAVVPARAATGFAVVAVLVAIVLGARRRAGR